MVFGGSDGVDPEEISNIQQRVQDGVDLSYILKEMTDLTIKNIRETTIKNLTVQYIEQPKTDDIEPLSADELEDMFLSSPDE